MALQDDPVRIGELIGRVYDTALHPERWPSLLAELRETIGADSGVLAVATPSGLGSSIAVAQGFDERELERVPQIGEINPLIPMGLVWPIDRPLVASRDFGLDRLRATRFYREWLGPRGDLDCIAFGVTREGDSIGHWALMTRDTRGPITEDEIRMLELIAPHVRRAVEISNVLGAHRQATSTFEAALGHLDAAVLFVDAARRIVYANPRAEQALASGEAIRASGRRLHGATDAARRALRDALDRARPWPRQGGFEAEIVGTDGETRLLFAVPLAVVPDAPAATDAGSTMLVIRSPRQDTRNPVTIAARTFELTPMQVQVLSFLLQGHPPEGIADILGVSVTTVRTHLAELFRRTGTGRQADLVARAMSLASPLRVDR